MSLSQSPLCRCFRWRARAPRAPWLAIGLLTGAAALAASGAAALLDARVAIASQAESAGLALLERLEPRGAGQPYAVRLNGQRLSFSSRLTPLPVRAVLDAFERGCQEPSPNPAAGPSAPAGSERWLVARHSEPGGSVGQSACVARSGARSVPERLWDFVRAGDLASLGQARYVLARRAPGSADTHVLELWAPGALSLGALLAGRLQPDAEGAERLLDARVDGAPGAVQLFTSPEAPSALLARYERRLAADGFEALGTDASAPLRRAFLGADRAVLITAQAVAGRTLVSRVEMARPRATAASSEAP